MLKFPLLYINDLSLFPSKVLLTMVAPSTVKLPLLTITAFLFISLNPVITTSHNVTSAVFSTVKKCKALEFPSKTTSPSEIMVNFLPEIICARLSAPE